MAARSTSRFKQKPAVPFGDFMIPILGVIALGIVVVGIRLLWSPSVPNPAIIAQPKSTRNAPVVERVSANNENAAGQEENASKSSSGEEEGSVSKKVAVRDVLIAQPVQRNSGKAASDRLSVSDRSSAQADTPVIQIQSQRAPRPEPKKAEVQREPEKKAPVVARASAESSAFVVQCGSYTTRSAANSVVASLKKLGHSPVVRKAEVNGKTYFRVIVDGGADRAQADKVAVGIKASGHPVFVRPND